MKASSQKMVATSFMKLVAGNRIAEAYDTCVAPSFRHHNAYYPGDAESLRKGMQESAERFPNKQFEIQRTVEEGDLVMVHSRMRPQAGMPEMALVHIFRFENGLIAELWDIGQAEPDEVVNTLGLF